MQGCIYKSSDHFFVQVSLIRLVGLYSNHSFDFNEVSDGDLNEVSDGGKVKRDS